MKTLRFALSTLAFALIPLFSGPYAQAHDHKEHQQLAATEPQLSGGSLYNLSSKWISSTGEKVALPSLVGSPRIVAMLYTKCKTACPLIVQDLKKLQLQIPKAKRDKVIVTVFSLDPVGDTPEQLRAFSEHMNLDKKTWQVFSPGGPDDVAEMAAVLGVQYKRLESGDYIHSNVIFLLNSKGEIVEKKEGLKSESDDFNVKLHELVR